MQIAGKHIHDKSDNQAEDPDQDHMAEFEPHQRAAAFFSLSDASFGARTLLLLCA